MQDWNILKATCVGLLKGTYFLSLPLFLISYVENTTNAILCLDRPKPPAGSKMRDKSTINRIKMYKSGGKVIR